MTFRNHEVCALYSHNQLGGEKMANQDYSKILKDEFSSLGGFIAAAIADSDSGMALGTAGGTKNFDIDVAAAANTEVVKAKAEAMKALKLDDAIEDILISLGDQYHLIRPLTDNPAVFIYLALKRSEANLALARMRLKSMEGDVSL
jgi:hypothetical protein